MLLLWNDNQLSRYRRNPKPEQMASRREITLWSKGQKGAAQRRWEMGPYRSWNQRLSQWHQQCEMQAQSWSVLLTTSTRLSLVWPLANHRRLNRMWGQSMALCTTPWNTEKWKWAHQKVPRDKLTREYTNRLRKRVKRQVSSLQYRVSSTRRSENWYQSQWNHGPPCS